MQLRINRPNISWTLISLFPFNHSKLKPFIFNKFFSISVSDHAQQWRPGIRVTRTVYPQAGRGK